MYILLLYYTHTNSHTQFTIKSYNINRNMNSTFRIIPPQNRASVHFDIDIDISDEFKRSKECDSAQHQEKHITREESVTEEFHSLK